MDEFRRTEANMTAKERREAADDISKTETEIAEGLDVTRAEISRQVKAFQRMVGLPPSPIQKSPQAVASYHRTRSAQLT